MHSKVNSNHAQRVLSFLNEQRSLSWFCDAKLTVGGGGRVYNGHRNILACFSGRFQESEPTTTMVKEVSLPEECPTDGLELLLDFFYTGELKLDSLNLENVRQAADSLCVPDALALCLQFATEGIKDRSLHIFWLKMIGSISAVIYVETKAPLKRGRPPKKRGRPKKSQTPCSGSSKKDCPEATATTTAITTRSGSRVKASRRLLGEGPSLHLLPHGGTTSRGTPPLVISLKDRSDGAVEEGQSLPQPTDITEVTDVVGSLVADLSYKANSHLQPLDEEDYDDDDGSGGDLVEGVDEDTDEDYVPHALPSTSSSPKGRRKGPGKAVNKENGEGEAKGSTKGSVHNCLQCHMSFDRLVDLRLHTVSHTGEMPNKCTSCSEQFMHKKDLRNHEIKIHGAPKPHACSLCSKAYLSKTELRLHEASKHRGEKLFVCEECDHRASSRHGLQMHIKAIHSLGKHHRTHTGERPYSCEFCNQRFTEKGPMLRHVASKHQDDRPHCCKICSKTFKAVEQLHVHVRRHQGMRKFECQKCGYKFTRQAHLRRHVQVHTRTENYNPRERKLRNLIVKDVGSQDETSPSQTPPTEKETPEGPAPVSGPSVPVSGPIPGPGTVPGASDILRVVIKPLVEEVGFNQGQVGVAQGHGKGLGVMGHSFTVTDVMEQTLLVADYPIPETTVELEDIQEDPPAKSNA
ncbi:unnamed protein product [Coregonus sp. 'balchen']|nr:unnamed protein product [Coregonus sp. 'balchen']